MRLLVKWKSFKSQIDKYLNFARPVLSMDISKEDESFCNQLIEGINNWKSDCHSYLRNSFDTPNNEYAHRFYLAKPLELYIKAGNKEGQLKIDQVIAELKAKSKQLEYILRLLSISDAVIQPELIDLYVRATYSKKEIKELLLDKLYYLYDKNSYAVQSILRGNGINISDRNELINIVKELDNEGYVRINYSGIITARLTVSGRAHVENKRTFGLIDTFIYSKSGYDVEAKIITQSEVTNLLVHENDVLISELKELKTLYHSLQGKKWAELLKVKLTDLESASVINKKTMLKIYRYMTNEKLKFV